MELLDLIETYRAEDATLTRLYAREGRAVRGSRRETPQYRRQLLEATRLYKSVLSGRAPRHRLSEAMSTSDFPLLFGDIIDRAMLGAYQHMPVNWQAISKRGTVRDFRNVKRFTIDGGEAPLAAVPQGSEYQAAGLSDGVYEYSVEKYGKRLPFTWESFVDDDLDALRDMPTKLATSARLSEEKFSTGLYTSSGGPNSTFFSSGHANIVTGNPALSVSGLTTAFTVLASQVDTEGNPINVSGVQLVVPPALKVAAMNILHATQITAADGGGDGTGNNRLTVANWLTSDVELTVNPWLPIINTTSGNTAWYLFSDPTVGRPAMEMGFLATHPVPEIFQRAPNAVRVGGGLADPMDGDFETDSVDTKVRHVFGGCLMEYRSAVASTGAGS